MDTDSIFTKIVKGEIPSHKVYEDGKTFAFLDIHPVQPGHVLVVPKRQVSFVWDLEPSDYQAVMATAHKVALALRKAFPDKNYVAMHIEGLDIAHAHLKLFPFNDDAEFRHKPDMEAEPNHEELAAVAARVIAAIDS